MSLINLVMIFVSQEKDSITLLTKLNGFFYVKSKIILIQFEYMVKWMDV